MELWKPVDCLRQQLGRRVLAVPASVDVSIVEPEVG